MSTLSYLNALIDASVESATNYDTRNKENLKEVSECQSEVDEYRERIEDIEGVLAIGGLSEDLEADLKSDLAWFQVRLADAKNSFDMSIKTKTSDDEARQKWYDRANELRTLRDKYKESL